MSVSRRALILLEKDIQDLAESYIPQEKIDIKKDCDSETFHEDFKNNKNAYIELQQIIILLSDFKKEKTLVYDNELYEFVNKNLIMATKLQANYLCNLINFFNLMSKDQTKLDIFKEVGYFETNLNLNISLEKILGVDQKPINNSSTRGIYQLIPDSKPSQQLLTARNSTTANIQPQSAISEPPSENIDTTVINRYRLR